MTSYSYDAGDTLAHRFRRWAGDRSTNLYAYAMQGMADDWEAGGPIREAFRGYEQAPSGAVVQLRLLAGVFRLVLTGRADDLLPYYPCLGGTADPAEAWPVLRSVIADHIEELREALEIAPQTNEVGRCAALLVGLLDILRHSGYERVRLLELGASGGLNLLMDRYAIHGPDWVYGPAESPVQLREAVRGEISLLPLGIDSRRGCDLHPVDPGTPEGRLLLTSFVWPFDVHRHERLAAALAVVDRVGPVHVDQASAAGWLAAQLADPTAADVLPVVWNSITQQYWPAEEIRAVSTVLDEFGSAAPVARVAMEFRVGVPTYERPEVRTWYWAGDGSPAIHRLVGNAHDHGVPVEVIAP